MYCKFYAHIVTNFRLGLGQYDDRRTDATYAMRKPYVDRALLIFLRLVEAV